MAFKFTVDYQQLKLVIQTDSTEAVNSFEHLKSTVQFIDMQQIVAFQQLTAADVFIDADTKNLYFSAQYNSPNAESFGFTDSDVFDFGKASSDTPIISEELAKVLDKALADSASVTEELSRVVQYVREFTDAPALSEALLSAGGPGIQFFTLNKRTADWKRPPILFRPRRSLGWGLQGSVATDRQRLHTSERLPRSLKGR